MTSKWTMKDHKLWFSITLMITETKEVLRTVLSLIQVVWNPLTQWTSRVCDEFGTCVGRVLLKTSSQSIWISAKTDSRFHLENEVEGICCGVRGWQLASTIECCWPDSSPPTFSEDAFMLTLCANAVTILNGLVRFIHQTKCRKHINNPILSL